MFLCVCKCVHIICVCGCGCEFNVWCVCVCVSTCLKMCVWVYKGMKSWCDVWSTNLQYIILSLLVHTVHL